MVRLWERDAPRRGLEEGLLNNLSRKPLVEEKDYRHGRFECRRSGTCVEHVDVMRWRLFKASGDKQLFGVRVATNQIITSLEAPDSEVMKAIDAGVEPPVDVTTNEGADCIDAAYARLMHDLLSLCVCEGWQFKNRATT